MAREEERTPCDGPIGALGISSETALDLGKERRTTTRAPPAEMFTAVANSSDSLPFSSRLRTKTGIARRSRAHLRCSFLGEFVRNRYPSKRRINPQRCRRLGAKPLTIRQMTGIPRNVATTTGITVFNASLPNLEAPGLLLKKCNVFRLLRLVGAFPIDSLVPLTYDHFTLVLAVTCSLPWLFIKLDP